MDCCNGALLIHLDYQKEIKKNCSVCFSVDLVNGVFMMQNGSHLNTYFRNKSIHIRPNGSLYFGQEQDFKDGGFNRLQSFRGYMSEFLMYDRLMTEEELLSFVNCSSNFKIDKRHSVCNFSDLENDFLMNNVAVLENESSRMLYCHNKDDFFFSSPKTKSFKDAVTLCHSLGGALYVPENSENNKQFFSFVSENSHKCKSEYIGQVWVGSIPLINNKTELSFQHYKSSQILGYHNVKSTIRRKVRPLCASINGDKCASLHWQGGWIIVPCEFHRCVTCYFEQTQKLHLRGLCLNSQFDRYYYFTVEDDTYYFFGEKYSFIKYIPPDSKESSNFGIWKLFRLDVPDIFGEMKLKYKNHLPIGKNSWTLHDNNCETSHDDLILTVCSEHQFTCNDGTCVSLKERCDFESDCSDNSDEIDCQSLIKPPEYSNIAPPPRLNKKNKTSIKFYFDIFAVKKINIKEFTFAIEMSLTMIWRDSRLTFRNLREQKHLNITEDRDLPWTPQYFFLGDEDISSDVQFLSRSVIVRKNAPSIDDNDENIHREEIFLGKENDLVLQHKFILTTYCLFDLSLFPFNSQKCKFILMLQKGQENFVILSPIEDGAKFHGVRRQLQFYVRGPKLMTIINGTSEINWIEMKFDSLSSFYITNTYVPTLILLIIGYLPFYFPIEDFNERIVISITSLLVEATFFSQLSNTVPKTAYMKLIDIWCLFCIVIIFCVSLLLTWINYMRKDKQFSRVIKLRNFELKQEFQKDFFTAKKLNFGGKIIIPLIVAIFSIIYVVIVFRNTE
ncbi:UNVERIFIED_CONTAM: hypothetical protein RMT77_000791 [Armadillidium vulgare]